MNGKLPYYMAYPMPMLYDDERISERDYEYMRSLYPILAKRICPYVEEECERLAYECSMMYDECPDQLMLRMMCGRIYRKVVEMEQLEEESLTEVRDLIEVLTYQEICKKRCLRRKERNKFY